MAENDLTPEQLEEEFDWPTERTIEWMEGKKKIPRSVGLRMHAYNDAPI